MGETRNAWTDLSSCMNINITITSRLNFNNVTIEHYSSTCRIETQHPALLSKIQSFDVRDFNFDKNNSQQAALAIHF